MRVQTDTWRAAEGKFCGNECAFPLGGTYHGCHQLHVNDFIVQQARRLGGQLTLSLDAHFVRPETKMVQDILLQNGNKNGWRASSAWYQMNAEQAYTSWNRHHWGLPDSDRLFAEALEGNAQIISMVEPISIPKKYHLPEVTMPIELSSNQTLTRDQKLQKLLMSRIAFHGRFPKPDDPQFPVYMERLAREIKVIAHNGKVNFLPYFLNIDIEICTFARENGIPVGPGRGCLSGSSMVVTPSGAKKIQDIQPGDLVVDGLGCITAATDVLSYPCDEPLIEISSFYGAGGLRTTADHEYLISRKVLETDGRKLTHGYVFKKNISPPDWIRADQVEEGDLLVFPKIKYPENRNPFKIDEPIYLRPSNKYKQSSFQSVAKAVGISKISLRRAIRGKTKKSKFEGRILEHLRLIGKEVSEIGVTVELRNEIPALLAKTYDLGMFLGMWVGNGWLAKNKRSMVGMCCRRSTNSGLIERLVKSLFGLSTIPRPHATNDLMQYEIHHSGLRAWLMEMFSDYDFCSGTKYLPDILLETPEDFRRGLRDGLWATDGCFISKTSYSTTSARLARNVFNLLLSLGHPAGIKQDTRTETRAKYGAGKISQEFKITTSPSFGDIKTQMGASFDGQFIYCRVRRVKTVSPEGRVWDITVPTTKSYLTDGGVVHNSAAGSLLAYLLRITSIDPIIWDLSFERFLSMGRIARGKFPDIDIDLADPKKVVAQLSGRYTDCFARICTTGTMKLKGALRDICRILLDTGNDVAMATRVNELCNTIENMPQGADSKKWLYGYEDGEGRHVGYIEINQQLRAFLAEFPQVATTLDEVMDVPKSVGRHASAYCLSDEPLTDLLPMCELGAGNDKESCTQFTMGPVEALGLIKYDLLGLNTLKDIAGAIALIKQRHGLEIDIDTMEYSEPLKDAKKIGIWIDDPAVFDRFCSGRTETVFQFKSAIATNLCKQVKPRSLLDLANITANGRPGTMYALLEDGETTLIDAWVARRQGRAPITYVHPDLEEILKPTDGIFTYQESLQAAFVKCCDYSAEESDLIREIMGKKKPELLAPLLPPIREKLLSKGWQPQQVESFVSSCVASARYVFNKCLGLRTLVYTAADGQKKLRKIKKGDWVLARDTKLCVDRFVKVVDVVDSQAELWKVTLENAITLETSMEHKYLCEDGVQHPLWEVLENRLAVITKSGPQKVVSVSSLGICPSRDLEVDHPDHNFYANGVVVSNSHSVAYAYIGYICMWLKTHFPLEWWNSVLENSNNDDLKDSAKHVRDIVIPPEINTALLDFYIIDDGLGKLVFPLNRVKNVKGAGQFIWDARHPDGTAEVPFLGLEDFYNRVDKTKVNKRVVASLIWAGAFDRLCSISAVTQRNELFRQYLTIKKDKDANSFTDLPEEEILKKQMEMLAIGSADFVELLRRKTGLNILDPGDITSKTDDTAIRTGGLAARIKVIKIKKEGKNRGREMCFIDLGNESNEISVTVFPDRYEEYKNQIVEGQVLLIRGRVNRYNGKLSLIADSVEIAFPDDPTLDEY